MRLPDQVLAITLVIASATCHRDRYPPANPASEVSDSAGIKIIENPRPPADSRLAWEVSSEPDLTIGSADGDAPYLFDNVRGAARLPDDHIVIADGGSGELRVFDAAGSHTSTWSRAGEGPGEFNSLAGVHRWLGDSLVAWDTRGEAIAVFDLGGNLGRTFSITGTEPSAVSGVLRGGGILTHRETLAETSRTAGGRSLVQEVHYRILDAEGRPTASLGVYPGRVIYSTQVAGQAFMLVVPFSRSTSAIPWGEFVVVSSNHRYEIRAYDADGVLQRIVRRDHALIDSTPAHLDAHFLDLLGIRPTTEAERDDALRESRQAFGDIPLPETLPTFATVMSDALDHLWVREFEVPAEEPPSPLWTVFDPGGLVLGYVETPRGLDIHEIGADYIVGRTTDDLGVEYVQLWPLRR